MVYRALRTINIIEIEFNIDLIHVGEEAMSVAGLWTIQFAQAEEDHGGIQVSEEVNRGGIWFYKLRTNDVTAN